MLEVFILANGNREIGMGHINRSLMLRDSLASKGIRCIYLSYDNDSLVQELLDSYEGLKTVSVDSSNYSNFQTYVRVISNTSKGTPLLYIDSDDKLLYGDSFQKGIVQSGIKLMYATLYDQYHYYAHLVFNQNIMAIDQRFSTEEYTKLLLGPAYFLWPEKVKSIKAKDSFNASYPFKAFVNFGNADPNDVTSKLVSVLLDYLDYFSEIIVVVGKLYQKLEVLQEMVKHIDKVEILQDPSNLYELMRNGDIGFCSLGMTNWELTLMNIPAVVVPASEREVTVGDFMHEKQYAFQLGHFSDTDWKLKWNIALEHVIVDHGINKIKTQELYDQININGIDSVVNEMLKQAI